jgi:ankyrin repeat protein
MPVTQNELETQLEIFLTALGEKDLAEFKTGICNAWALMNFANDLLDQKNNNIIRMQEIKDLEAKQAAALYQDYKTSYTDLINERKSGEIAAYNRTLDDLSQQRFQLREEKDERNNEKIFLLEIKIKKFREQRSQLIEKILTQKYGKEKLKKMRKAEDLYIYIHALYNVFDPGSMLNYHVEKQDKDYRVTQRDFIELFKLISPVIFGREYIPFIKTACNIAFTFTHEELISFFENKIPNTICDSDMMGISIPGHAFYISFKNGKFLLYNPDLVFEDDRAEILVKEIENIYSDDFDEKKDYVPIQINILTKNEIPYIKRPDRIEIINNIYDERQKKGNYTLNGVGVDNSTAIYMAARSGHTDTMKILLEAKPNINIVNKSGMTPLIAAMANQHFEIIDLLVNYDKSIVNKQIQGKIMTPFAYAVKWGEKKIVEKLLRLSRPMNILNEDNLTVAHIAAQYGQSDILKILYKHGFNCSVYSTHDKKYIQPIDVAAMKGHVTALQTLIELEKLDLNTNLRLLYDLAFKAAANGHFNVIHFLHEQYGLSYKIIYHGETLAVKAAREGHLAFIQAITSKTSMSKEELIELAFHAASNKQWKVVDFLHDPLGLGLDLNTKNFRGETLAHYAIRLKKINIIDYLIENKIDLTVSHQGELTPLELAAINGYPTAVETIISKILPDEKTKLNLAFLAASNGHIDVIQKLNLRNLNACDETGESLATYAARNGLSYLIDFLIEQKADLSRPDANGNTPAYLAADHNHVNVVKTLTQHRINLNIQNKEGDYPIHIAILNNNTRMLEELIKGRADIEAIARIDHSYQLSPFDYAMMSNNREMLRILIDNHVNLYFKSQKQLPSTPDPDTLAFSILYPLKQYIQENKLYHSAIPSYHLDRIIKAEINNDWKDALHDVMKLATSTSSLIKNTMFTQHSDNMKDYLSMFSSPENLRKNLEAISYQRNMSAYSKKFT